MSDHVEPECAGHLFLSDVCARHMDHGLPMGLGQPICQLTLCQSSDDLGLTID